jgi:hypothetical protein
MCFNVKIFVKLLKILALTANLSHISRVQKPGLRPMALAFLYPRPGPAFFGLAWPSFWPQARAGTSLTHSHQEKPQLLIHSYKLEYARVSAKSADLSCK